MRIDSRHENMGAEACKRGRRRHEQTRAQTVHEARGEEGSMTDRRDEDRERTRREQREQEGDERRQKERGLRSNELKEAWRRHHPSEEEDTGRDRPRRGRTGPA